MTWLARLPDDIGYRDARLDEIDALARELEAKVRLMDGAHPDLEYHTEDILAHWRVKYLQPAMRGDDERYVPRGHFNTGGGV